MSGLNRLARAATLPDTSEEEAAFAREEEEKRGLHTHSSSIPKLYRVDHPINHVNGPLPKTSNESNTQKKHKDVTSHPPAPPPHPRMPTSSTTSLQVEHMDNASQDGWSDDDLELLDDNGCELRYGKENLSTQDSVLKPNSKFANENTLKQESKNTLSKGFNSNARNGTTSLVNRVPMNENLINPTMEEIENPPESFLRTVEQIYKAEEDMVLVRFRDCAVPSDFHFVEEDGIIPTRKRFISTRERLGIDCTY